MAKAKTLTPASSATEPRDFIAIADEYARRAVEDVRHQKFGLKMRLAAKRYLNDRKRAEQPDCAFYFSDKRAEDACKFIETLPHIEGSWETEHVVLHASHVFFVVNLFGFRNRLDDSRRFTSALFAVARKNAKSFLAAAILLYCICCEKEEGPQLITAATTGSQARVVFNVCKRIVEKRANMREHFNLETFANSIVCWDIGGTIKPINAKASTQDGLNPSHTCLDEVHAHKNHALLNVLQSAAGARKNPLWLYTTTEGYETPGPWPELRHFATQVVNGLIEADHFLAVMFAVDDEIGKKGEPDYIPADEDFDETKWIKANPLMEVNPILKREIIKASIDAKQMPGRHAEFRIKRLNRQSSTANGWTNLTKWRACNGAVDLNALVKVPCWGGLDLSATSDLTSLRLIWEVEDRLFTFGWCWVPEVAVKLRAERGLVPYAGWIESGALIKSGDDIIDYDDVFNQIKWVKDNLNLQGIGYDDWNSKQLLKRLTDAQVPMVQFIQGTKSYHPAMKDIEEHYVTGRLAHAGAPVLAWCASNLVARRDANLNTAPDKKSSFEKIDDMVALFMARGTSLAPEEEKPKYQMMIV